LTTQGIPDVLNRTALSRGQIDRLIEQDDFAKQVRLGERGRLSRRRSRWLATRAYRAFAGGGRPVSYCGHNGTSVCANVVTSNFGAIGGGRGNSVGGYGAVISGGGDNEVVGNEATVGGGDANSAGGQYATVPGGANNTAAGTSSFASGQYAQANHNGSFVWSDSTATAGVPFASTGTNQFLINASGGVGMGTNAPQAQLDVRTGDQIGIQVQNNSASHQTMYAYNNGGGTALYVGSKYPTHLIITTSTDADLSEGGVWENASDRNLKSGFQAIDVGHVLSEVVTMPITRWFYKSEGDGEQHIGPVAQDFYAAFKLGNSDKTIGTVDEGGVALAAIQGLNKKIEDENSSLKAQNALLKSQLDGVLVRLTKLEKAKGE
jgi:hypothetical protein